MNSIMKKILYFAIALAGVFAVACEPEVLTTPEATQLSPVSADALKTAFVIDGQFADAACTQPQADGNNIKFHTTPSVTVQISNLKADGSKNVLVTGASGVFNITPKRGADSNQPFTVATINQDASVVSFDSSVNVYVPADLSPEVKVLTGESGAKAWKWYTIGTSCWGNCGYIGVAGQANVAAGEIPGYWWGCIPEELETEQIAHTGGTVYGYGDPNAYMVFNEDGECISYKSDGTQIVKGTYSLNDYDPSGENYLYGTLVTTDAPVLMPFKINSGGQRVNEFEVIYIDQNMMSLIYKGDNSEWGWGEATWWRFKNASDPDAALAGAGQRAWTYNAIDGATWGNCGYIGVGGQANVAAGEIPGYWWGCVAEDLETSQVQHAGGVVYGYGSEDAYMVFDNAMGTVTSYAADGSQIASSAYSVENFDWTVSNGTDGYKLGDLMTPGETPGLLFPFIINKGGEKASEFEILYLDGTLMTLIYKGDNSEWGWGEATWWRFQPKK